MTKSKQTTLARRTVAGSTRRIFKIREKKEKIE